MEFTVRQRSQRELILLHLKHKGKLSPLQALREYKCLRLAAVVHRLRSEGYKILTDWREQGSTRYAVYRLEGFTGET